MSEGQGAARPTTAETITESLRERVLSGELEAGRPLREEQLAAEYGASRHTVRTALAALVGQRLAFSVPFAGIKVADFDQQQVRALQELRTALECEAARLLSAAGGSSAPGAEDGGGAWPAEAVASVLEVVDELQRRCEDAPEDWPAIERAHAEVHAAIVAAAGSTRIAEVHGGLIGELELLMLHARPLYDPAELGPMHRRLVDELQERGSSALREHLAVSTAGLAGLRVSGD